MIEGVAIVAGMTVFAVWAVLFNGPSTLLAVPVPRSWRAWYRSLRGDRDVQPSQRIPRWMRRVVLRTDGYRCVWCGKHQSELGPKEWMQVDHAYPWIAGGLTCLWNLFTLCPDHNRQKSCWRWENGRARGGRYGDRATGIAIYRRERRLRWNPLRWARLAWMLAA